MAQEPAYADHSGWMVLPDEKERVTASVGELGTPEP
jgi:hypothetical protein